MIERLGSAQPVNVDVRIIAATNRNLEDAVRDKTFREDLYHRLNVFPVLVPPLRQRVEDIPALAWTFVDEFAQSFGKTITSISAASLRDLQRYSWPGNVRDCATSSNVRSSWPPALSSSWRRRGSMIGGCPGMR